MQKLYNFWTNVIEDKIIRTISVILLLGPTLLAIVEVFRRYIIGKSYYWQADVVVYFILAGVFLHFGITQRREDHLQVTLVLELLSRRGPTGSKIARILLLISRLASLLFLIFFAYWGYQAVERTRVMGRLVASLIMPIWPFFAVLIVGFALMGVAFLFQMWRDISELRSGKLTAIESEITPVEGVMD